MWPSGTPDVVVGTLKISLDLLLSFFAMKEFSRVLSCDVAAVESNACLWKQICV